jgi:hypothetical protein
MMHLDNTPVISLNVVLTKVMVIKATKMGFSGARVTLFNGLRAHWI